jgi:predicted ferric reductase
VRVTAGALLLLAAANAAAIVFLWWHHGGISDVHDGSTLLTTAGRLSGLLGAASALAQVVLLARLPALERRVGFDRLTVWHRRNGKACLGLLLAHAVLVTAGYTLGDRISLPAEIARLVGGYPGVITALAALVILAGVVVTSLVAVRRRLRYETWWFVHLYAYLAIALAFSHQIATGTAFVGDAAARAYWTALYLGVLAVLVGCRLLWPVARSAWHGLRVERVVEEAPGVVSVEIGGRALGRLRARSGQFFLWRFLTRDRWWEAHPFSLSAAPDGRRLRITVKSVGDFTGRLAALHAGTRVVVEGPFGAFTTASRRRARVALIAGGVGITPIRALLEDMPGGPGDIEVIYRALSERDVILRGEIEQLAERRGTRVHYVLGDHREPTAGELLTAEHLRALVPDIAARDVYVCGPPAMADATRESLLAAAVPRRQIVMERVAL